MVISCRPLDTWPGERTHYRRTSPFQASYSATIDLLERELAHLKARDIVLLVDCEPSDLRLDGRLRADAKLRSPGVVLVFESSKGPLKFPCDRFMNWPCNVRAIALSLEALRKVDRYGVTSRSEQYTGWTALPPATASNDRSEWSSVDAAALWLVRFAQVNCTLNVQNVRSNLSFVYREAAKLAHPDTGGSDELMAKVNRCRDYIEAATEAAR